MIHTCSHEVKQVSETFRLCAVLSLSGGFQDAYTYMIRGGVFANAQTGNVVLMSQHFMLREWSMGIRYLFPLLSFAIGIVAAEQIEHKYKQAARIHWRQIVLLVEIIALALVAFMPAPLDILANTVVSFTCAMQVQTFRKVHGYGYASTMCIGNLRAGTESMSAYIRSKNQDFLHKALHYYGIILFFAIGAGIGGIISKAMGIKAILISCLLLLIGYLMMTRKEARHEHEHEHEHA